MKRECLAIKTRNRSVLGSEKGSALVAVVMLLGVLLPLVVYVSDRILLVYRMDNLVKNRSEFDYLTDRVALRLSKPEICLDSFGKQPFGSNKQMDLYVFQSKGKDVMLSYKDAVDGFQVTDFHIDNIYYTGPDESTGESTYAATLYLAVKNSAGIGPTEFRKTFEIAFSSKMSPTGTGAVPNGMKMTGCSLAESISATASAICESLGGVYSVNSNPRCRLQSTATASDPIAISVENQVAEYMCTRSGGKFNLKNSGKCTFELNNLNAQIDAVINLNPDGTVSYTKKEVKGLNSAFLMDVVGARLLP